MKYCWCWLSFLLFCASLPTAHAQYTVGGTSVLWRVTGKGISKASYLYGTFHLRDKRAFNFADSVLPALESCQHFAIEVRLDTLIAELIHNSDSSNKARRLKHVLTKQELDSIAPTIAASLGIPPKAVPDLRPGSVYYILQRHNGGGSFAVPKQRTDKPTFLDAYLLGVARALNKNLCSLEPAENQMGLLDNLAVEEIRRSLLQNRKKRSAFLQYIEMERMIRLYSQGNMDSLLTIMKNTLSPNEFDTLLVLRNRFMARTVDSLAQRGSVFAAMGSAHLGGEGGVIALLRTMGYTVEAVEPSYNGGAKGFDSIDVRKGSVWHPFESLNNGFRLKMPCELAESPYYTQSRGSLEMDVPLGIDIITGCQFFALGMRSAEPITTEKREEYTRQFVSAYAKLGSYDSLTRTDVHHGDASGYEYKNVGGSDDQYRIQVLFRRSGVYVLLMYAPTELLEGDYADTYFNSVEFFDPPRKSWQPFTDSLAALSLAFRGKPLYRTTSDDEDDEEELSYRRSLRDESNQDTTIRAYYSSDIATGTTYSFSWNDIGMNLLHRSIPRYLRSTLRQSFFGYSTELSKKNTIIDTLGENIVRARYWHNDTAKGSYSYGWYILRGNRIYDIMIASQDSTVFHADSADFFGSVSFLPFHIPQWKEYSDSSYTMAIRFPAEPTLNSERNYYSSYKGISDTYTWSATDAGSGREYAIMVYELSPYLRKESLDSAFALVRNTNSWQGDTVVSSRRFTTSDGYEADEYLEAKTGADYALRSLTRLIGNRLYRIITFLPRKELQSAETEAFFTSFRYWGTPTPLDLHTWKSEKWFTNIASTDSARYYAALNAITTVEFDSLRDIPRLYAAINFDEYPLNIERKYNYSYGEKTSTREQIIDILREVHDSTTVPFLRTLYGSAKGNNSLQWRILNILSRYQTAESYSAFVDCITTSTPIDTSYESWWQHSLYSFRDSIQLVRPHISRLSTLLQHHIYKASVYSLLTTALDSALISKADFQQYRKQMLKDIKAAWAEYQPILQKQEDDAKAALESTDEEEEEEEESDDETYSDERPRAYYVQNLVSTLVSCIRHLPADAQNNKLLRSIMMKAYNQNRSLSYDALMALVSFKQPVPDSMLRSFADDYYFAAELLRELDSLKSLTLLPQAKRTQRAAAAAYLAEYLYSYDEDEEIPESIEYLSSRDIKNDSVAGKVYLMKYSFESDTVANRTWYVATVGLFPSDGISLRCKNDYTILFYKELDAMKPEEHFDYLLSHKDGNPWEEEED